MMPDLIQRAVLQRTLQQGNALVNASPASRVHCHLCWYLVIPYRPSVGESLVNMIAIIFNNSERACNVWGNAAPILCCLSSLGCNPVR